MLPYRFDTSGFPLVLCTAEGDISQEDLDLHLAEYRNLLDRGKRYALTFDATNVGKIDVQTRKRYAEFMKTNANDFERLCVGCGFIISSAVVRGALTAVLWLTGSLPFPHKIFSNQADAEAWARAQLKG